MICNTLIVFSPFVLVSVEGNTTANDRIQIQNTPTSIAVHPLNKETVPSASEVPAKMPSPRAEEPKMPLPADTGKTREPVDFPPPPTMASGNSSISGDDWKKTPQQVMKDHEALIRGYINKLDRKGVVQHLKIAARHHYFDKFLKQLPPSKRFGEKGIEDIVEYDLWLKKLEISEKKVCGAKPAPNTVPVPTPKQPAVPTEKDDEPSPSQKAAYDGFWKKFKQPQKPLEKVHRFVPPATPESSSPATSVIPKPVTPSPSPPSEGLGSKETPSCKKRLDLEEGLH